MKIKLRYKVEYETIVDVKSVDDVEDSICDVEILESEDSRYVKDSFDVVDWEKL